jgi:glutathione-regulated potassium-efflux system protein KefB
MHAHGFLENALVFLLAAVIAVPLFKRLKLGAVLAYLVAGALIGPYALKLVDPQGEALAVSELGVVLLLFLIGLEVSYARLWLMRRAVFAVGSLQVLLTATAIGAICLALGQDWRSAAVAAIALAMSSTAIGVQLLAERHELNHAHGRSALAVLLFQDLVAIPAIALLPLLGQAAASTEIGARDVLLGVGKIAAALAAVYVVGRFGVRPLLRWVAGTRSVEAFTATTLLIALGTAQLTALAGLSLALGAFLAGLLLAESEYRHEIEANIEPFKGLLLGMFFVGVGLTVDWQFVGAHALEVLLGVVVLLLLKSLLLYALGRTVAGGSHADALKLAALLAQGGEFAFVLLSLAAGSRLLGPGERDLYMAIVVLSMAATPLLVLGADRALAAMRRDATRPFDAIPADETPRVIIAGFGRMGQIVGRVLHASRIPFVALEHSAEQVDNLRRFGNRIYYGDPSRPELLRAARAEHAQLFVLATDDPEANLRTARIVKRLYPRLKILARARNRQHAFRLLDLQVDAIVRETFHSSLVLARQVLEGLGFEPAQAASRIERFQEHDERVLRAQHLVYDDEAQLIQSAHEARAELEQLFEADADAVVPNGRKEHA